MLDSFSENLKFTAVQNIKSRIQAQQIKKDPFLLLGEGMNGYRSILRAFIVLYGMLSILAIPIIYIYNQGEGFEPEAIT